jgi:L-aspartate oxidase
LLEAVVYSHRAAEQLAAELAQAQPVVPDVAALAMASCTRAWGDLRADLRQTMWADAGIVRSDARLRHAGDRLGTLLVEAEQRFTEDGVSLEAVEARNLAITALLVVRSALLRQESRGLHYNTDYPYRDNERFLRDTVVKRDTN